VKNHFPRQKLIGVIPDPALLRRQEGKGAWLDERRSGNGRGGNRFAENRPPALPVDPLEPGVNLRRCYSVCLNIDVSFVILIVEINVSKLTITFKKSPLFKPCMYIQIHVQKS
jgi:hypothetical protein